MDSYSKTWKPCVAMAELAPTTSDDKSLHFICSTPRSTWLQRALFPENLQCIGLGSCPDSFHNPPFVLATLSIDPLKYGYIIDSCYNSGLKFRRLSLKTHLVMISSGYSVVLFFPGWPVNLQYSFGSSRDLLARLKAVTKCQDLFLVPTGNDLEFLRFSFFSWWPRTID